MIPLCRSRPPRVCPAGRRVHVLCALDPQAPWELAVMHEGLARATASSRGLFPCHALPVHPRRPLALSTPPSRTLYCVSPCARSVPPEP